MTEREKERHLADLFLRAGNARNLKARWINYHLGWVGKIVKEGFYTRMRDTLEKAIHV